MNHIQIKLDSAHLKSEISGTEKKALYLSVNLTIDDASPILSDDAFDMYELFQAAKEDGTYFIFTCSCGIAGCAGYFKGVKVTTVDDKTTWENLDDSKRYEFLTSQLKLEIENLHDDILIQKDEANLKGLELSIFPNDSPADYLLKAINLK
ncbi:hypothetical protein WSM22_20980 [Cytophagales bacterium WSM2-2]|nr:hypothetical protein WSM22_20980 [Cytophagales bacterium WSM2-2]